MEKKQRFQVGYVPSDRRRKYFEEFCRKDDGLRPQQLIDVALDFLMMRQKDEIDSIILGVMTGRWDQESFEVEHEGKKAALRSKIAKKAAAG